MLIGHLYTLFGEMSIQSLGLFLNQLFFFLFFVFFFVVVVVVVEF